MTPEQILAKVFADIEQVKQEIQENPQTASMFLPALMEMFTKFGFFAQMETGEPNTIKWLIPTLIEIQNQVGEQKVFGDSAKHVQSVLAEYQGYQQEMTETGSVPEELLAKVNPE